MRILLLTERRDERGATAVLAAVLSVLLVGIAAFTVDFGRAYLSKRELQNASDAGALAGASFYADKSGDCLTLRDNTTYASQSQAIAAAIVQESRPGATLDLYEPECNPSGELVVTTSTTGSTQVAFGGVYGANGITTQRSAEATLEVVENATRGLRPYMICSFYAPPPDQLPTTWKKVDFPSDSDTSGNCPHDSGNWFTLDCPHAGNSNNGNPGLAAATRDGCGHMVSVVDPQDLSSPAAHYNSLSAACPADSNAMVDYDPDCLTSNPGNIQSSAVLSAWGSLIDKTILLPVFCEQGTGSGQCNPAGWVQKTGGGNNTMYPVSRFASVTVCGYHWGNNAHSGPYTGSDPKCGGSDATPGGNDNYLNLAFVRYQFSGSTEDSNCPLDDPACDGGSRQVRLTK